MSSRFRRLQDFSRVLHHHTHSVNLCLQPRQSSQFAASYSRHGRINIDSHLPGRVFSLQRFSTVAETSQECTQEDGLLSFLRSAFEELEGPYYCWLNKLDARKGFPGRNDVFLILASAFPVDPASGCSCATMLEKVKLLQQRYPKLHVIGFQSSSSIFSEDFHVHIAQMTMKNYITFPILLSSKKFTEVSNEASFILFKGFESPVSNYEEDVDIGVIDQAVKEMMLPSGNHGVLKNVESTWVKQADVIREPLACSSLQNLLLYFPGCISVDESGNRLFLSDINHHRVIIFDGSGKILDCIGSSPGFEDGDFDTAKLLRPAASFYRETEDCLYIVDSENHAVRRADMEQRVLETIYPPNGGNKTNNSIWHWIMDKLGMERDDNNTAEKLDSRSFLFPWHLIESSDGEMFVINQSLGTLWIMDLASGAIKETINGLPKILEICGDKIPEKSALLEQISTDWLQKQLDSNSSIDGFKYAGLVSSLATFQDHVVICDGVGQRVLKIDRGSGISSMFNFTNFGVLGLPYWGTSLLERVYVHDGLSKVHVDHVESFSLLPGKVDIQLNVDLPEDTELVEPLQEGSVWRQARGAAIEVSGAENKEASTEKVGIAQQWYDEIDHLVSPQEVKLNMDEQSPPEEEDMRDGEVCIDCTIHTSPGTSEVIVFAALYLKLKRNPNSGCGSKENNAAKVADILNPKQAERSGKDPCFQYLMNLNNDLEELVFMKPLHVRLKFECPNHPKAVNSKDIILTDSAIEVNVSLR